MQFLQGLSRVEKLMRTDMALQVSGEVTYNGHQMNEFVARKTSAYISQLDLQTPELTVRENLDFYNRVQGVGNRFGE